MTAPQANPDPIQWQQQYSADSHQWQDVKRRGEFNLVIFFLLVISTSFAVGYAINNFDHWLFPVTSQTMFDLLLLRMLLIFLTPTIMVLAGFWLLLDYAGKLIREIYKPKAGDDIPKLIKLRLLGVMPLPPPINSFAGYPSIMINKPELEETHSARWFGGPGKLVIFDGFAAYLERGSKFSRVVGPSSPPPFLERFERVKEIVDLRPQTKSGHVEPWTKDGIRIKLKLDIEVQIDAGAEALEKSANLRYPFDALAVKAAVEYTSVRLIGGKLEEQTWLDGAWGSITGAINAFVAGHALDELFVAPQSGNHTNANHSNHETLENIEQIFSKRISDKVINDVRDRLHNNGIQVLNVQLTELEVPKEVLQLRTKYWEIARDKISAQRDSHAEAERIRARELAHAEAQRTMLTTIMTKLENVEASDLTEALILSLSGILDQNLEDPIIRPLIAKESFAVLDRVKKMLQDRF
jgi:hypothetical protein